VFCCFRLYQEEKESLGEPGWGSSTACSDECTRLWISKIAMVFLKYYNLFLKKYKIELILKRNDSKILKTLLDEKKGLFLQYSLKFEEIPPNIFEFLKDHSNLLLF
jgi:hypothetical protein